MNFNNLQLTRTKAQNKLLELYKSLVEKMMRTRNMKLTSAFNTLMNTRRDTNTIKKVLKELFLKNKLLIAMAILFGYLLTKWYKDKQYKIHCKQTKRNLRILKGIEKLLNQYSPTFWLPGGMLKAIYYGLKGKLSYVGSLYIRETHSFEDGEVVALDYFPRNYKEMPDNTPFIVFMPGVTGDSQDEYSTNLCKLVSENVNWRVCVINRRGYGGMPYKGEKLSCFTILDDLRTITKVIKSSFPKSNIYLLGVSMGAFQVHKYLQIYGLATDVKAASTIANPWSAFQSSAYIKNNYLVDQAMTFNFKKHVKNHMHDPHFLNLLKEKGIGSGN